MIDTDMRLLGKACSCMVMLEGMVQNAKGIPASTFFVYLEESKIDLTSEAIIGRTPICQLSKADILHGMHEKKWYTIKNLILERLVKESKKS